MKGHPHLSEPGSEPDCLSTVVVDSLLDAFGDHDAVPPLLPARLGKHSPLEEPVSVLAEALSGGIPSGVHSGLPASGGSHSISFRRFRTL